VPRSCLDLRPLSFVALGRLGDFKAMDLVNTMNSLASLGVKPDKPFLRAVTWAVQRRMRELDLQVTLTWSGGWSGPS
jgi:hypothetical protein